MGLRRLLWSLWVGLKKPFLELCKCWSLFLTKLQGSGRAQNSPVNSADLLRSFYITSTRLWHRCFPVNFAIFLRKPFIIEHLWWLLLLFTGYGALHQTSDVVRLYVPWKQNGVSLVSIENYVELAIRVSAHWRHELNWTYIRRSEDVLDVF